MKATRNTTPILVIMICVALVSCASGGGSGGGGMGAMMGNLAAMDQANNPRDASGNYIAKAAITEIKYTVGSNFFTNFSISDGDGIKKLEFAQVPDSVYVMNNAGDMRYPGKAAGNVWELAGMGSASGPVSYQISVNSQAAGNLDKSPLILAIHDGKGKVETLTIQFVAK